MECYAGINGDEGQTVLSNRKVRKFRERADGLYDIIDVPAREMTEMEKRKEELFHLTQESNEMEMMAQDCEAMGVETNDTMQDGPLGDQRMRKELHREEWEGLREDIRPFRSFSEGIGKRRESSDADIKFRAYAFENDVPVQYLQRNPKRKSTKNKTNKSWQRYERYKVASTLREMIEISIAFGEKTMSYGEARGLALRDIVHDYEHGFIYFPSNESGRIGHWINARQMAEDYDVICVSSEFDDQFSVTDGKEISHAKDNQGSAELRAHVTVAENCGESNMTMGDAIGKQFAWDKTEQLIDDRMRCAHVASESLKKMLFCHPETKKFHIEPANMNEAKCGEDAEIWRKSMEAEIAGMTKFEVWSEMLADELPAGAKLLGTKWVFKIKTNRDGFIEKFKSRLVCLGYAQKEHVHFDPNNAYAPVMSYDSFRTLLAIGCANDWEIRSADIQCAFLQGDIDKEIYLRHPLGRTHDGTPNGKPLIVKLRKGQYGLRQSARLFAKALQEHIAKGGMKSLVHDPCLFKGAYSRSWLFDDMGRPEKYKDFVLSNPGRMEQLMGGSWVDDLTQIGSCDMVLDWFIMYLRRRFFLSMKRPLGHYHTCCQQESHEIEPMDFCTWTRPLLL